MLNEIFALYKKALLAHIGTKTVDSAFHAKSEEFYGVLFECFHKIGERAQDNGKDSAMELKMAVKDVLASLRETKYMLEKEVKAGRLSVGEDNLYRSLIDSLENSIGDAKAFEEESEEDELEIDDHLKENDD